MSFLDIGRLRSLKEGSNEYCILILFSCLLLFFLLKVTRREFRFVDYLTVKYSTGRSGFPFRSLDSTDEEEEIKSIKIYSFASFVYMDVKCGH